MNNTDTNTQDDGQTFLNEAQKAGKASGKIKLEDFEQALDAVTNILVTEAADAYRDMDESEYPKAKIALYCHDCRKIVPAGEGKTQRGKSRLVCGDCKSRKVSRGKEEALKKFYHIREPKEKTENKK